MLFNVFSLKYFQLNQWVGDPMRPTGDHSEVIRKFTLLNFKVLKLTAHNTRSILIHRDTITNIFNDQESQEYQKTNLHRNT